MKYATILVSALILTAVLIPGRNIPDVGVGGVDKLVHIAMFTAWAIAVRYDYDRKPFPYLLVFFLGVTFSAVSETVQILAKDRTFDVYDLAADALGLVVGLLISGPVVRWVNRLL